MCNLSINPLMAQAWVFDLYGVCDRLLYADHIRHATNTREVEQIIHNYRETVHIRPKEKFIL